MAYTKAVTPGFSFVFVVVAILVASQIQLLTYYPENGNIGHNWNWDFAIVTDQDKDTSVDGILTSYLQLGNLIQDNDTHAYSIEWKESHPLTSHLNVKGRGMELSALDFYNNDLLAFCDRSGMVFQIEQDKDLFVRTMLRTGNGSSGTPFKTEWTAQKDGALIMGGSGKEWVEDGEIKHSEHRWVKQYDPKTRKYTNLDWNDKYDALRTYVNATWPGYMITEAATWDDRQKQWLFLPRKISDAMYDEVTDEVSGSNILLKVSADFHDISHVELGPLERDWGFSELKMLPRSAQSFDLKKASKLLAVKVKEVDGVTESKMCVFDTDGKMLLDDTPFADVSADGVTGKKFEGLAFIPKDYFVEKEEVPVEYNFLRTFVDSVIKQVRVVADPLIDQAKEFAYAQAENLGLYKEAL